jgi:hypothetical protein
MDDFGAISAAAASVTHAIITPAVADPWFKGMTGYKQPENSNGSSSRP